MIAAAAFLLARQTAQRGIECVSIDPTGPAYKAGIRERDVMLEFDGKPVRSNEDLRYVVMDCVRKGRVAVRMRHGTVLIDPQDLGDLPHYADRLKARFEPEIASDLKPLRIKALALEKESKWDEAIAAFEELAEKAKAEGDWMNYARASSIAARDEMAKKPGYVKGEVEARIKDLEAVREFAAQSNDDSVDLVARTALHETGYALESNATNRGISRAAFANYGELRASLATQEWSVAEAFLTYLNWGWTQQFGRVGYNRDQAKMAIRTLRVVPNCDPIILTLLNLEAYNQLQLFNSAFDGDYTDGIATAHEAIALARKLNNRGNEAHAWWVEALAEFEHGNDGEALEAFQHARKIVQDDDANTNGYSSVMGFDLFGAFSCRVHEALIFLHRYDFDNADAAIKDAREYGAPTWAANISVEDKDATIKRGKDFADEANVLVLAQSGRLAEAAAQVKEIDSKNWYSHNYFMPAKSMDVSGQMIIQSHLPVESIDLKPKYWTQMDGGSSHGSETLLGALIRYRCRAVVFAKQHKRKEALDELTTAQNFINAYRPDSHDRAELAIDEARVYDEIGTPAETSAAWQRAVKAYRSESATALGESGRQYAGSLLATAGNGWVGSAARTNDAGGALLAFESTRAASLANATAAQDTGAFAPIQEALKELDDARLRHGDALSTIAYAQVHLKEKSLDKADRAETEASQAKAREDAQKTQAEIEKRELEVQQGFVNAQSKLKIPAIDPQAAIDRFPADAGFIGYSINEKNVVLLAVRKGRLPVVRMLAIAPADLSKLIDAHRDLLTDRHSALKEVNASGLRLGNALLPSAVLNYLKGCKRLVLAPDGPLWGLSFASLQVPGLPATPVKGAKRTVLTPAPVYVGARWPLQYAQSLGVYTDDQRPKSKNVEALVVGDPAFSGEAADKNAERGAMWGAGKPPVRLPATKEEADAVAGVYGAKPLTGAEATEAAVRSRIERARIVHFATHGYFNPNAPEASGILLAPGPEGSGRENDGALQGYEILHGLHLDADLVVLSACETARGRYLQGEGVIGLTRALQIAGARTICASQWRVADATTASLMTSFHRRIAKGTPIDEALQAAMVESMKTNRHPYYWSPFLLVGRAART